MKEIKKSSKLEHVLYDIRGPIMDKAKQMEAEGRRLIKLNIGNLAVFGFDPPEEVMRDMIYNLPNSAGYSDSKGIFAARKAVMHYTQDKQIEGVTIEDIYLGNGASDLIALATNALLDEGDELLVPTPDYPLWTAVTSLAGAKPVHYLCDESKGWIPSIEDIRAKVTPRTKGIVVINPNNPTGVLYPNSVLLDIIQVARENGLVILADEVYDKILYDGIKHTSMAALSHDVLTLTFNSLSKAYRACGYRAGWMVISGDKSGAKDFIDGLNMLANMKLCANVPGQWAIQTALGGYQSINDLVGEGVFAVSATSPTKCFPPFRAFPSFVRRRLSTCSRGSTRTFIRSRTTASSLRSFLKPRMLSSFRARASTGRSPTISAWSSFPMNGSFATRSTASPSSLRTTAAAIRGRR